MDEPHQLFSEKDFDAEKTLFSNYSKGFYDIY